ncbi:MAG: DUF1572 family protein [Gemmatimonadales bacterium]|nr:DUF1572 family protein [Gemmatimonadales bacterium]
MLVRELTSARQEIEAYPSEADIWLVVPGISNSGGNLALHLAGNIRHFVGAIQGGTGYRRDRDAEFATRNMPRGELVNQLNDAIAVVEQVFSRLRPEDLAAEYKEPVAKVRLNTGEFLTHLLSHAAYHLGQIDYHRRIVTGSAVTVGTVAPNRLRSARPAE